MHLISSGSNQTYPKKPSIYYRTKVRPGELITTKVVIEKSDEFRCTLQLDNVAVGTYSNVELKTYMTTDEFYNMCTLELGSKDFSMNKDMCNFVKTNYGKLIEFV